MNIKSAMILGGVVGSVAGSLITFFFLKKKYKEEIESLDKRIEELLKDLENLKEDYEDEKYRADSFQSILEQNGFQIVQVGEETEDDYKSISRDIISEEEYDEEEEAEESLDNLKEEITNVIENIETIDEMDEDDVVDPYDDLYPQEEDELPYILSDPEMFGEFPTYTMCYCKYYTDGVLADAENGAIYEDLSVIGGLSMIAVLEADRKKGNMTTYIRNEKELADFEIVCVNKKYSEDYS